MAAALDLFAPGTAPALALLGARVGGLVMVAPVFSARSMGGMLRAGLVVLLTLLLGPIAHDAAQATALTPASLLGETAVGFAIGLGAAILVGAAEAAGDLMGIQIGLSGAALFDPMSGASVPALGQFMQLFAITLLLSFNLHHVMIDALAASVRAVPLGAPLDLERGVGAMVSLGGTLFGLGLRFAAPVIAAGLVTNVALAVLSRAAPQLNVLAVAFPVQIAIGLFTLFASLSLIATFFGGWTGTYDAMLDRVFGAMLGGR